MHRGHISGAKQSQFHLPALTSSQLSVGNVAPPVFVGMQASVARRKSMHALHVMHLKASSSTLASVNHMFCTVFSHDKCLELSSYQGR